MLARVAQCQHRRLGALEERHAGVGEGADDLLIEVAARERAEGEHEPAGILRQRVDHRAAELSRRRAATGVGHVGAQVHRDHVDGLLAQHDVEELREEPRVLVHRARTVERIPRIREVGHEALHGLDRGRRQRRELHAGAVRGIGGSTALAAKTAQHPDPPGARRVMARGREERERVDHLVEARDVYDAALPEHGLDDLRRAGQRPGVRQHRLARVLRAADLEHHDRFAKLSRSRRRLTERLRLLEPLDERADHRRVVIFDQVREVILDREAGLVAARHDVAQPDAPLLHQIFADRVAEPAALRHDADRARPERLGHVGAEGRRAESDIEDAVAVRAADKEPVVRREALELGLSLAAFGPRLGESAREHDGSAHPGCDGRSQDARHLLGRDRHDHGVGALRRRGEVGIAGQPEDVGIAGVDREDPSGVTEALEVGDYPCRAGHPLRGADHGDARRLHQGRQVHWVPLCHTIAKLTG